MSAPCEIASMWMPQNVRRQTMTSTKANRDLCRHVVSIRLEELILSDKKICSVPAQFQIMLFFEFQYVPVVVTVCPNKCARFLSCFVLLWNIISSQPIHQTHFPYTQKRKGRKVDNLGIHWRLTSTSPVNIRAFNLTTFLLQCTSKLSH